MADHRMAKVLRVVRKGAGSPAHLEIDGELFPFFTVDGFAVHPERGKLPCVSVTIVAERVEVEDDSGLGAEPVMASESIDPVAWTSS